MGHVFIGWPNRLTDSGAALSGGDWAPTLPLSNILNRTPSVIARSVDLDEASTQFDLTLPADRVLKAFALTNHNLTISATWRLSVGTTLGGADQYDSGWLPAWMLNFDDGLLEWESPSWWPGSYDDDYIGHPFASIHVANGNPAGRYLRVEISDPSNPEGYVQLGRLFAGSGIEPAYNMTYAFSQGWVDTSTSEAAIGGSEYYDERRRYRQVAFELPWIDQTTEFRQHYEMQRRLGTTGECLYLPDIADMAACQLTGFVGRMEQLSPIEYPFFRKRRIAYKMRETL